MTSLSSKNHKIRRRKTSILTPQISVHHQNSQSTIGRWRFKYRPKTISGLPMKRALSTKNQ